MHVTQQRLDPRHVSKTPGPVDDSAQLVLAFGGRDLLGSADCLGAIRLAYPSARVLLGSTAGEIRGTEVSDDQLVVTAIRFDKTRVQCVAADITGPVDSRSIGESLARQLLQPELVHVFVVSDGALVNGTELSAGFNGALPAGVRLSGGLAGDGARFEKTLVGLDEAPRSGRVVAIGFYGTHLRVGCGSSGGWMPFGPERTVTRARGNVLFQLDGRSALALYKQYLGDKAQELPASALRFPLCITPADGSPSVVRTILSIDEAGESMTFAGDIPDHAQVRFMRASYEDLIDGAAEAAEGDDLPTDPDLALCVSCVGRKIVLGQRVEEETEVVRNAFGADTVLAGFYSYGELAPAGSETHCQLHNQTMTITAFRED